LATREHICAVVRLKPRVYRDDTTLSRTKNTLTQYTTLKLITRWQNSVHTASMTSIRPLPTNSDSKLEISSVVVSVIGAPFLSCSSPSTASAPPTRLASQSGLETSQTVRHSPALLVPAGRCCCQTYSACTSVVQVKFRDPFFLFSEFPLYLNDRAVGLLEIR